MHVGGSGARVSEDEDGLGMEQLGRYGTAVQQPAVPSRHTRASAVVLWLGLLVRGARTRMHACMCVWGGGIVVLLFASATAAASGSASAGMRIQAGSHTPHGLHGMATL